MLSKDLEFIRKGINSASGNGDRCVRKMVPFAQELISMFHPGWIKGGGSNRY